MTEHTPTPWRVHGVYPAEIYATVDEKRFMVADILGVGSQDQDAINAAFIVKAVNSHAALIKALEDIAKGEGRFSRDPFTHACNTIEDLKKIAQDALDAVSTSGSRGNG